MSHVKIAALGPEPAKIRFYYGTSDMFNSLNLRTSYRAKMIKDGNGESQLDDVAISQDELDIVKELMKSGVYKIGARMFKVAQGVTNSIFFDSKLTLEDSVTAVTAAPVAGGTGYVQGDLIYLTDSAGSGAIVTALTVANGVVTAVTLLTGGHGYTTGTKTTISSGAGTGCTVAVTTVAGVNGITNESSGFELVDNAAYNANVLPALDEEIKYCLREYCLKEWFSIVGSDKDITIHSSLFDNSIKEINNLTFQLRKPTMS